MSSRSSGQVLDRSDGRGLADVVELILDKGLVIDVFARVSVIGIEIITVEIRIVVASIDTYLRYAEAIQQLTRNGGEPASLPGQDKGAVAGSAAGGNDGLVGKVDDMTGKVTTGTTGD